MTRLTPALFILFGLAVCLTPVAQAETVTINTSSEANLGDDFDLMPSSLIVRDGDPDIRTGLIFDLSEIGLNSRIDSVELVLHAISSTAPADTISVFGSQENDDGAFSGLDYLSNLNNGELMGNFSGAILDDSTVTIDLDTAYFQSVVDNGFSGSDFYVFSLRPGTDTDVIFTATDGGGGADGSVAAMAAPPILNVTFTPVPEPTFGVVAVLGCVGYTIRKRFRRKDVDSDKQIS